MSDGLLIQMNNLHKSFGDTKVLNNISLSVASGEYLSIIGKSGSGKSTLLSIMGLLEEKSQGFYALCGHNTDELTKYQQAKIRGLNIGWVFQHFHLLNDMTVLENVLMPTQFNQNEKSEIQQAKLLLDKVGLGDKINAYPGELSGGQQQRVAIARALIMSPDVLYCDEPTGNLDSSNAQKISDLLCQLNQEGMTIVLVTHDPELANQATRTIEIADGRIVNAL